MAIMSLRMNKFLKQPVSDVSKIPITEEWLRSKGRCQTPRSIFVKHFHKEYSFLTHLEKYNFLCIFINNGNNNGEDDDGEDDDEENEVDEDDEDDEQLLSAYVPVQALPLMTPGEKITLRNQNTSYRMQTVSVIWQSMTENKRKA